MITIVAKQLGKSSSEVTTNHTYRDLGVDELDRVEIVMELEEEFEVNLPLEEAEAVQSIATLVQLVQRHLA